MRERGATGWLIASADSTSLVVTREDDGMRIVVIAGRQIRTEGGLEVLSFFSRDVEKDGRPLATVVEEVLRVGGVPVVPWGFGKWWGQRGAQVRDLLESSLGPHVMLADSSTRPRLMPRPPGLFKLATGLGVRILAGTDPLPFPGQERKIGRYGFILEGELRLDRPAVALRERLLETRMSPRIYGSRESILAAVRLQTAMQIRRVRARTR